VIAVVTAIFHVPGTGFQIPSEIVVLGAITGLTYSLLAVALVLGYKMSRVINFAHGEMGALAAYFVPWLVSGHHWPYAAGLAVALVVALGVGALMELLIIRPFTRQSRLIALVATIGFSQVLFAVSVFLPRIANANALYPTPFHVSIRIGNLRLGAGEVLILLVVPVITAVLILFMRFTKAGLATRCAAENNDAARLAGIPVRTVSLIVWTIIGLVAGLSAVLLGPTRPVVSSFGLSLGPNLLVRGLAAAMIAGLEGLSTAFLAGIGIGVVEALLTWNYPRGGVLEVVLFALIIACLLLRKGLGAKARGGEATSWSLTGAIRELEAGVTRLPAVRRAKIVAASVTIVLVALVPLTLSDAHRVTMSAVVLFAAMGLSLVVLTGFAGQISLGQFAFVGLGAIVGGRANQLGYPWWMCLIYATVAGALVALVIGVPALRIRGLFLAVVTLAFAVAVQQWVYGQHWLVHLDGASTSLEIPRPRILGINFHDEMKFYWLTLVVFGVLAALVHRLRRTGLGRAMIAVRDNEVAAATMGIAPRRTKLAAFVIAGMMASFAGYFYGALLVNFPSHDTFGAQQSLTLVGFVILGGVTTITGSVLGAIWIKGMAALIGPLVPDLVGPGVAVIVSGVGLLGALYQFPAGIAAVACTLRDAVVRRLTGQAPSRSVHAGDAMARPRLDPAAPTPDGASAGGPSTVLAAEGVTVRFGGNTAVDDVSIRVTGGAIVGLVGPNGAGKTTLFDVLSGQLRPTSGTVTLHDEDITALRPEQRARLGLGRTFQQARLFDGLRLFDAIKIALELEEPTETVPALLGLAPSRAAERRKDIRAGDLLDLLGLRRMGDLYVSELSTGTRRIAELGCLVALGADVLLLDEPTAGIAQREVEMFRPVLREIRDHLDATMLVIEHDIPLMMDLVDHLYVLSAGRLLAEGPPHVLRDDPAVIAAYLGTDDRVIHRSGAMVAASTATAAGVGA
jgi:ABC-type branched-subunit amino acid transport system ATPase component/ABC-type branched-subunit amino acid transport system permease subunit